MIRRRHVLYVEGYDPQGAEGYYAIFQRSLKRFLKIWPVKAELGPLEIDAEFLAHWEIETTAPNWQVHTRYEFVRQEQFIRSHMAEPMPRVIRRALCWAVDYQISGTMYRIFRASWRYAAALLYFQLLLATWLLLAVAGGALVGIAFTKYFDVAWWLSIPIGIAVAFVCFKLLRPIADSRFVVQINCHWPYLCEFARGEKTAFDAMVNAGAERLVMAARANAADEILVIGHSGGSALAPAVIARALELDPNVGRHGPRIVMLTLGSIMAGAALHPKAKKLRAIIERVAVEPTVRWIDVQATKDALNFVDFDPVSGIGVDAGAARCNPHIWQVRIRDMLKEDFYRRLRWNFFRLHYQVVMANDVRAVYDYLMLICGPFTPLDWAQRGNALLAEFGPDASHKPQTVPQSV